MAVDSPISRRRFLEWTGACGAALLAPPLAGAFPRPAGAIDAHGRSVVILWNEAVLQGLRESKLGPPMAARALAIVHTCIYDAWAAYDRIAVGTRLGGSLRRPPRERTLANKNAAMSFAAHRAAVDLFPGSRASVFEPLMARLGYDPRDASTNAAAPNGSGTLAAQAVIDFRHRDGSNQLGDEQGGIPGVAYSDTTGFVSANAPMDLTGPFDAASVRDPNAWQPLRYVDASGVLVTQLFVGAHWQRVVPFALASSVQFRSPTGPARAASPEFRSQAEALLRISATLTDEQKAIAEYWADGPKSELPPGHWNLFAQVVSARDRHGAGERGLERDAKLFFALTNAIFDAGICAWDNKCAYASVRPITALRYLFQGRPVQAWGGPYQGTKVIAGERWLPYQASTFPTPPFPEYASGHSCFSAAAAEILRLFTGSDAFGNSVTIPAGSSKVEPGAAPPHDVKLTWPTFRAAADEAGLSRRYGGIHFEQGDLDARAAGRAVARGAWAKAQAYFAPGRDHDRSDDFLH
jgi:hypothetical protein